MPYYTIASAAEEFACPQCGDPSYVGDRAFEAREEAYCSSMCAKEASE